MKKKLPFLNHVLLLLIILFSFGNQVYTQEKVNISAGVGIMELINLGLKFQLNQKQIGIGVGFMPAGDESVTSFFGDFYFHFAGKSKLSTRRPWYGKFGLNYFRDETESAIYKYLYLNLKVGRDFNISKRVGIALEAGGLVQLMFKEVEKTPTNSWGPEMPVLPGIGVGIFYRFLKKENK